MDDFPQYSFGIRLALANAASLIQPTPDEEDRLESILRQKTDEDGNPVATIYRVGERLSSRLLALTLFFYLLKWDEHGSDQALLLDEEISHEMWFADGPDADLATSLHA